MKNSKVKTLHEISRFSQHHRKVEQKVVLVNDLSGFTLDSEDSIDCYFNPPKKFLCQTPTYFDWLSELSHFVCLKIRVGDFGVRFKSKDFLRRNQTKVEVSYFSVISIFDTFFSKDNRKSLSRFRFKANIPNDFLLSVYL